MRKIIFPLIAVLVAPLIFTGCAGPEQKLSRGIDNTWELVRLGEMRRSIEQNSVLEPELGPSYGIVHGFDRSMARTGIGVYEALTFPFPPYHPVATKYFSPAPVLPDSYRPGLISDSLFDTDAYTGFGGGEVAPGIPGSRFRVFDN
jgi:putative exosortase-associated protein (TIGR04073 family)